MSLTNLAIISALWYGIYLYNTKYSQAAIDAANTVLVLAATPDSILSSRPGLNVPNVPIDPSFFEAQKGDIFHGRVSDSNGRLGGAQWY